MSDKRSFIRNFWKERKMVGAMAPSSKYLAKKMLQKIDFSTAKVIVELGPGTGVFTRKILQKLSPDGILLVFELNDSFMNQLKKEFKDPRVILIHHGRLLYDGPLSGLVERLARAQRRRDRRHRAPDRGPVRHWRKRRRLR